MMKQMANMQSHRPPHRVCEVLMMYARLSGSPIVITIIITKSGASSTSMFSTSDDKQAASGPINPVVVVEWRKVFQLLNGGHRLLVGLVCSLALSDEYRSPVNNAI